jgi:nucleoside-diphosphate-sugar epimerase
MTRALVLGASGFVGRWIARLSFAEGTDVVSTARDLAQLEAVRSEYGFGGEIRAFDALDGGALLPLLREVRPDVVFNAIGYGVDPGERDEAMARAINADFVERLANHLEPTQRLIHIGSALEYGTIGGDLAESSIPHPTTLYGRTKLEGTERLRAVASSRGLSALTARLFTVYGPGEHDSRLLPSLVRAAASSDPIPFTSGTQRRDFTYVEDAARALSLLAGSSARPGEIVNVATGKLSTVRAFIEAAIEVLHISPDRILLGAIPQRTEEMQHDDVAIVRMRSLISWIPDATPKVGIARSVAFRHRHDRTATL